MDARRNYEQILAGATTVLKEDPTASLQDIALAVGLHRATLHRHFRSRDELIAVLRERAAERTLAELDAYDAAEGSVAERIRAFAGRVIDNAVAAGLWKYTTYHGAGMSTHVQELQARTTDMMEEGRRAGALRDDLDASALATIWRGVTLAVLPRVEERSLTTDAAAGLVMAALSRAM